MGKIEQELFDLEELLMRNDDMADGSTYITICGIANSVSELEAENAKLRELVRQNVREITATCGDCWGGLCDDCNCWLSEHVDELRGLGIEVG